MEYSKFERLREIVERAEQLKHDLEQARTAKRSYKGHKMGLTLAPSNRDDDTEFYFALSNDHKEAFLDSIITMFEIEIEDLKTEFDEA